MNSLKALSLYVSITGKQGINKLIILIVLSASSALLEMVGVGSIVPLLALIESGNQTLDIVTFNFDINSLIVLFLGLYFFAIIFRAFSFYQITRAGMLLERRLSSTFLNSILNRGLPVVEKLERSDLIKLILSDSNAFVGGILLPLLNLSGGLFTIFALSLLLLFLDVYIFFTVFLIFAFYYLVVFWVIGGKADFWGRLRVSSNEKRFNISQKSLVAYRQLVASGDLFNLTEAFSNCAYVFAKARLRGTQFSVMPRYFAEALIVAMIAAAVHLHASSSGSISLALMGAYVLSGLRIFPAAQLCYGSIQELRFSLPVASQIGSILRDIPVVEHLSKPIYKRDTALINSITFDNVDFAYADGSSVKLRCNTDLSVGERIFVVGPSGSGKSTFLDLLLGFQIPVKGDVLIDGKKMALLDAKSTVSFSYIPQTAYVQGPTIRHTLENANCTTEDYQRAAESVGLFEAFNVNDVASLMEKNLGYDGGNVSGGQRQRLSIAKALLDGSSIYIFDEALGALDEESERNVLSNIFKNYKMDLFIYVTHKQQLTTFASRVLRFNDGVIVDVVNENISRN